jgi:CRP/FNR family transcriptional regulator
MENRCILCTEKSAAACKLSPEDNNILSKNSLSVPFKKGDFILRQGTYSTNVAYLKKGLVKIQIVGPYFTQVVKIVQPGNYLGLPTTIGDKINQYSVVAIDDSEVCFIDITIFRKMLSENPDFSNQIILELCRSELKSYQNCVRRTQKQIRGKVADMLLDFAENIYKSDSFSMQINQEEMGNLVDSSRESISRVLNEFVRDGVINMIGKKIELLDKEHLRIVSTRG